MRVIDGWVNVEMPARPAAWQRRAAKLFKRPQEEVFRATSVSELIEQMDACGVDKAVLTLQAARPSKEVLAFHDCHPERFLFSALVDPRPGLIAVRELESLVKDQPVSLVRVIPSLLGLPPNDRVYYPLYAKCVELGLPVSVNTGIPGPPLPGACQDPLLLDDVCLFFPELVVIMAHGADPWWEMAVRLMSKYDSLYLMTSAYAPGSLPETLLAYMKGRGRHKVMFATDFPFLTMQRCLREARALELEDEVLGNYLGENLARVLDC